MLRVILVGLGGFIGAILRYLVSGLVQNSFNNFPGGTLVVNFIGSFVLSVVMFGSEYNGLLSDQSRVFFAIGLLGSFTTMSSFNYETFKLIEQDQVMLVLANIFGNIILGLMAVLLGRSLIVK